MIARCQIAMLAMFVLAHLPSSASAQVVEEPVSSLDDLQVTFGEVIAEKKKVAGKDVYVQTGKLATRLSSVTNGREINDNDKRLLETVANYYVFRVTWSEYANDSDQMEAAILDFSKFYERTYKVQNTKLVAFLNEKLVESFKKVFERDFMKNRLTSVNAAQMLVGLGRGKSEEISAYLVKLIKEVGTHQAIKFYAIKALRDYFPLQAVALDPLGDKDRVQALTEYIEQKWEIKETDKEKADMELAAVSFLRREAIQTLALAQLPVAKVPPDPKLPPTKKVVKNEAQVAVTLLKVLSKNALTPPPPARGKIDTIAIMGLAERVQASFGLCEFKPDPTSNYQPDLAVYAVGNCLSEFFEAYYADGAKGNLVKWDVKEFTPKGERRVPQLPWKTLAERWKKSLENLVDATDKSGNKVANNQARALQAQAVKLLEPMTGYKELKFEAVSTFRRFVETDAGQKPTMKNVFKSAGNTPEVDLGY